MKRKGKKLEVHKQKKIQNEGAAVKLLFSFYSLSTGPRKNKKHSTNV